MIRALLRHQPPPPPPPLTQPAQFDPAPPADIAEQRLGRRVEAASNGYAVLALGVDRLCTSIDQLLALVRQFDDDQKQSLIAGEETHT